MKQQKILMIIFSAIASLFIIVILFGMIKFNILADLKGYDVDGNKCSENSTKSGCENNSLNLKK